MRRKEAGRNFLAIKIKEHPLIPATVGRLANYVQGLV